MRKWTLYASFIHDKIQLRTIHVRQNFFRFAFGSCWKLILVRKSYVARVSWYIVFNFFFLFYLVWYKRKKIPFWHINYACSRVYNRVLAHMYRNVRLWNFSWCNFILVIKGTHTRTGIVNDCIYTGATSFCGNVNRRSRRVAENYRSEEHFIIIKSNFCNFI